MLVAITFVFAGCDIFGVGKEKGNHTNNRLPEFVLGKRVFKIQLGDSVQKVKRLYGEPATIIHSDGINRSWASWTYHSGKLAGLRINMHDKVVDRIFISFRKTNVESNRKPFPATTREGIGIGTSIETVFEKMGPPDYAPYEEAEQTHTWFYCVEGIAGNNEVVFEFGQDSVISIGMGHHIPYEKESNKDCHFSNGAL